MKALRTVLATSVVTVISVALAAAAPVRKPLTHSQHASKASPRPNIQATLYDQTDQTSGVGLISQDFEAAFDAYDNMAADDFVIPAATNWSVTGAVFPAVYFNGTGPTPILNLTFYADLAGIPGAAMCSYPTLAAGVDYTDVAGTLTVTLPTACNLTTGHYWVSPVARMDFGVGGEWGWNGRSASANLLSKWQNPNGGFGTGCATWADTATCLGQPGSPDFNFAITGTVVPVELQGFSIE